MGATRPDHQLKEARLTKQELERIAEMEHLLSSARCIAQRQGARTNWERFDESIAKLGISPITARTYKTLTIDLPNQRGNS